MDGRNKVEIAETVSAASLIRQLQWLEQNHEMVERWMQELSDDITLMLGTTINKEEAYDLGTVLLNIHSRKR